MKSWESYTKTLLLSILLGGGTLTCPNTLAQTTPLESIAQQRIAQRYNLPLERLTMIYSTTSTYRLFNQTAYAFKALDTEAATIYTITLDREGEEVNPDHLLAAERAAYRALYGKLEPELSEWVRRASASERKSVMIWVREPPGLPRITPPMPHSGVSQEAVDRYFAQVRSLRESQVASVVCPIADRCRERGLSVRYGRYVPVLYGELSASDVRLLEGWVEVESMGLNHEPVPFMDVARQAVRADIVEARGFRGAGVKVAMVEPTVFGLSGSRVETNNPYLTGTMTQNVCPVGLHATLVAGAIRSTHPTVRGIAPEVDLWAGEVCSPGEDPIQRFEQAIDWGARVGNFSAGDPGPSYAPCDTSGRVFLNETDRSYDTLVFKNRFPLVIAAGNGGLSVICANPDLDPFGHIASPARAYNVIAAGGYDDKDTPDWSDDCLYVQSSWCDPASQYGDREKPEMVAPAASIKSTLADGPEWVGCALGTCIPDWLCACRLDLPSPVIVCKSGYWGTSFAAPIVTGMVALMIQRSRSLNSALEAWPEAIKAILMATAVHNIEADTRLSECDGAGGVDAASADDVVRGVRVLLTIQVVRLPI
jgi:serine protease AprX